MRSRESLDPGLAHRQEVASRTDLGTLDLAEFLFGRSVLRAVVQQRQHVLDASLNVRDDFVELRLRDALLDDAVVVQVKPPRDDVAQGNIESLLRVERVACHL